MIVPHKKGDKKDSYNYRLISLFPHMSKLFTWILQKRLEKILFFFSFFFFGRSPAVSLGFTTFG